MFWQWLSVGILVVCATAYVVRQTYRVWFARRGSGCGGSCGCSAKGADSTQQNTPATVQMVSRDELTARLRQHS
jgi:hypothetical protein